MYCRVYVTINRIRKELLDFVLKGQRVRVRVGQMRPEATLSRSKYDANGAATEDERVRHVSVLAVVLHVVLTC